FRVSPGDGSLARVMRTALARGGVVSINHPISDCLACSWTAGVPPEVGAIEIANGPMAARRQAVVLWDVLLRSGHRVTGGAGSAWPRGTAPLGQPAIRVWAEELSTRAILDGLRHGRAVVLSDSRLPAPELLLSAGDSTARIGDTLTVSRSARVDVLVE